MLILSFLRRWDDNMNLQIDRVYVEAMVEKFPSLQGLNEQLRFGNRIEVGFQHFAPAELDFLIGLYQLAGSDMQGRVAQLLTLRQVYAYESERFAAEDLEQVVPALMRYLTSDAIRGWLFNMNVAGKPLAYVVSRVDYVPASNDETGKVYVELKANAKATLINSTIRITAVDIVGKTVSEILAEKGFLKETPALITEYDRSAHLYFDWRAQYGAQFSGTGTAFFAEDPSSSHRSNDWTRKDVVVLSASGGAARLVNDEGIIPNRVTSLDVTGEVLAQYLSKAAKSNKYDAEKAVMDARDAIPVGLFTALPVHGYILMFHLDLHHYVWVHVDDMVPYAYQPALKHKLVLPPEQTDLIDILTAEMDVLMDDIVAGKSGGTTVLCAGPAGVGKTLTAEVYAEIIKRPLYRVHSGQLGLNVAEMEAALKEVLTRAQRWGAVMLIDEADVYIRRRDNNMAANAVVGVFLRVLEYFNGLLFLTTNRVDDIDEAIVSRCIAMIKFSPPDLLARQKIWRVMSEQFGLALSDTLIATLADIFPEASGRDIKGLAKLTAKYCHHKKVSPSLEVVKRCSVFRGMALETTH